MFDSEIKSRPVYGRIALDATGRRHLLVVDSPEPPEDALSDGLGVFPEIWTVARDGRSPPSPFMATAERHAFRSLAQLMDALRMRLSRERMGFRLYAVGSETFLADVGALGTEAGLNRAEMHFGHAGSLARRVYCVHCRTVTDNVVANVFDCSGCGASLFVRDHFSSRLAAFMGVQVDAEVPGELPPIETPYA